MKFLTEKQLNTIRGKVSVGKATTKEILSVFEHLDKLEMSLDEKDSEDFFGTDGWRILFGLSE